MGIEIPSVQNSNSRCFVAGTAAFFALLSGGTSADGQRSFYQTNSTNQQTSPVLFATPKPKRRNSNKAAPDMLLEIRLVSGLTWGQLAQVFQVSRRAVHLWASGGKLKPKNEIQLKKIHQEVSALRKNQTLARKFLLEDYNVTDGRHVKATQSTLNPGDPILEASERSLKYKIVRKKSYKRKMQRGS